MSYPLIIHQGRVIELEKAGKKEEAAAARKKVKLYEFSDSLHYHAGVVNTENKIVSNANDPDRVPFPATLKYGPKSTNQRATRESNPEY